MSLVNIKDFFYIPISLHFSASPHIIFTVITDHENFKCEISSPYFMGACRSKVQRLSIYAYVLFCHLSKIKDDNNYYKCKSYVISFVIQHNL